MFKFKFFVHCPGWKNGGYENTHFAETENEPQETVDRWNAKYQAAGGSCRVTLLSVTPISDEEFAEDFIG